MKNYALIGDIHSIHSRLSQALTYCQEHDLTPIFLGDIFDSRCSISDSVSVYNLIRDAEKTLGAIVLQSNHQDKLIRYLKGHKIALSNGLDITVNEFKNSDVDFSDLLEWLVCKPYGVVFKDKNDVEYRCAHAYFSSRIEISDYEDVYFVHSDVLNKKLKSVMIYGPVNNGCRIHWWETPKKYDYVMVSGHYHKLIIEDHCLVLDGECGNEGDHVFLALYDVNKKLLKKFF